MSREGPKGPFTLWADYGCDGWAFTDFMTLEAAVRAGMTSTVCQGWHISRPVEWGIRDVENGDQP